MKVIYIAGPFRGPNAWEVEQNIRRAETLALEVAKAGFAPLCPHSNTRFFNGTISDQFWLDATLALLSKCDGMILTPDWERSSGAKAEREYARNHRISVHYDLEDLVDYYEWCGIGR